MSPQNPGKMKVLNPQYMGEMTPKNEDYGFPVPMVLSCYKSSSSIDSFFMRFFLSTLPDQKRHRGAPGRWHHKRLSRDWSNKGQVIWVFPKIGVSQNGWFIMENPNGWFGDTIIFGNTHMYDAGFLPSTVSSWWLFTNPSGKKYAQVKLDHETPIFGVTIKHIWNHQLGLVRCIERVVGCYSLAEKRESKIDINSQSQPNAYQTKQL